MTDAELKYITDAVAERVAITLLATEIIRSAHNTPGNAATSGGAYASALHEIARGSVGGTAIDRGGDAFAAAWKQATILYHKATMATGSNQQKP